MVSYMLLGKSRGQLQVFPVLMKSLDPSEKEAQQQMHLVTKGKSNLVKINIVWDLECKMYKPM